LAHLKEAETLLARGTAMQSTAAHRLPSVNIHPGESFALQLIPTPIAAVMAVALAAVHSNKKTVVYYELPRSTTSDARHSLDIWQRFQMPTTRAAARTAAEWIGIGGARLSLVSFVPHNWPRR
jgi:hypothetical protein